MGAAFEWARVVSRIPSDAWSEADRAVISARSDDETELRDVFNGVVADGDRDHRDGLRERIRNGDLTALGAFGDVRDLDSDTVQGLIDHLKNRINDQIGELERGAAKYGSEEPAATLVLINAWHPKSARWEPVCRLLSLGDTVPFVRHLEQVLIRLRRLSAHVPDEVAAELIAPLHDLMTNGHRASQFFGVEDVRGEAASALAALRPGAVTDEELWDLMEADQRERREAAILVLAARGVDKGFDTLWAMSRDSNPWLRAIVANQIAHAASRNAEDNRFLILLRRLLSDEGTLVARMVAETLDGPQSSTADQLADALRHHISARVRRAVAVYESRPNHS